MESVNSKFNHLPFAETGAGPGLNRDMWLMPRPRDVHADTQPVLTSHTNVCQAQPSFRLRVHERRHNP